MAGTTIEGLGGSVTIAGYNVKFASWSADYTMETVDTTGFDDGGFRTKAPVIASMTGSAAGTASEGAATTEPIPGALATTAMTVGGMAAATAAVVLTGTTGCTFTFSAVVTRVSMSRPVDGKMDVTCDFESTGVIAEAWAVS